MQLSEEKYQNEAFSQTYRKREFRSPEGCRAMYHANNFMVPIRPFLILLALIAMPAHAALPAAPSDLRLVSKGWNSFKFAWNDNARDEVRQKLYISEAGGPFWVVTAYKPDVTAAALQHLTPNRAYAIYLTAENASGESAASNRLDVFMPAPDLVAGMGWSPLSPTTADDIGFRDGSLGAPDKWLWTFSDGTTSTLQHPSKRLTTPGDHIVTLKVSKGERTSSVTKTLRVTGSTGGSLPLTAAFECGSCSVEAGNILQFADLSSGAPTSWSWSFGDGVTASSQHASHRYDQAGTFTVALTIGRGSDTSITTKTVTVTQRPETTLLVPVIARTSGAGKSRWQTELSITNSGASAATLSLAFIANGIPLTRELVIAPKTTRHFDDAVDALFAINEGAGALLVKYSGSSAGTNPIAITSRTRTSAGTGGTFGQLIAAIDIDRPLSVSHLPALRIGNGYRTNVGLVNPDDEARNVTLSIIGATDSSRTLTLPARSFNQQRLESLLPIPATASLVAVRVERSASTTVAYASVVDDISNDPSYVEETFPTPLQETVIPSAGRTAGVGTTSWSTELFLLNPAAAPLKLAIELAGSTLAARELELAPDEQTAISDVVAWLGGDSGAGALRIIPLAGPESPVVFSRTFTRSAEGGTFGQSIPPVSSPGGGVRRINGVVQSNDFRTNVGLVNHSTTAQMIRIDVLGADGRAMASATYEVAATASLQFPLTASVSGAASDERLSVVATATAPFTLYGSVIDNISGDPMFLVGN